MSLTPLETRLQYRFEKPELLRQAVTHRSHSATHNERLEFLGDSVLNCVVATLLFRRYATLDEGDLSRVRANLVRQQTLYEVAQHANLAEFLRLGEGELKSGGMKRPSILADTLEAIIGAIYLDGGFAAAEAAIAHLYQPVLAEIDPLTLGKDAKTLLQEHLQGHQLALPQYVVSATHGAAHNQQFEVECAIPRLDIRVKGAGASRRSAEQAAAKCALERLLAVAPAVAAPRRGKAGRNKPGTPGTASLATTLAAADAPAAAGAPGAAAKAAAADAAGTASAPAAADRPAPARRRIPLPPRVRS